MSRNQSLDRRILGYDPGVTANLYLAVACGLVATSLVLVQAWLMSRVLAGVFLEGRRLGDVGLLLTIIVVLAAFRCMLQLAGEVNAQNASNRLKLRLRRDLTEQIARLGPGFTGQEHSGELTHTAVRGIEDLDEYITAYQPLRLVAVVMPLIVVAAVLAIDPLTVTILLLTGPALVLLMVLIGGRAREATALRFQEMSWTSAYLLDMLRGLPTLKLFGRSKEQAAMVRTVSRRHGERAMEVLRTAFETSFVLEMCSSLAVALVAVEVSLRLLEGALPFERALAVLLITPEFFLPLRRLSASYHAGATGRAAAERIFALLDMPTTRTLPVSAVRLSPPAFHGDLRIEGVSYWYEPGRQALRDFSLTIPERRVVALIGETGAGKSTVADLLLRFIEPQTGMVTKGGRDIREIDEASWRTQVAWVPQRPHLFQGTIRENIRMADPLANDDRVIEAAIAANAHGFITAFARGYETLIGEGGARLSGGERQRVAIARAFLKDAPFLILDEATSYLDAESEAQLSDAVRRLVSDKTALIIAHRPQLVRIADEVVVLQHGEVVDRGPPTAFWATSSDART